VRRGRSTGDSGPGRPGEGRERRRLCRRPGHRAPPGPAGRRRAAVSRLFELRHVQELRGARQHLPGRRRGHVTAPRPVRHPGELRWETRLLGVVTLVLLAFGVAATYGAASLVTVRGQSVGLGFAVRQLSGALLGGLLLLWASRQDYYRWRAWAWPLLLITIGFLLIPLLPFTRTIAPVLNGARRWVDIGPINFQPSELAR